jgi:hypothetical protein
MGGGTRVQAKKKMPKVNAKMATRLLQGENSGKILEDDRFSALFQNRDFEVDEEDEKYKFSRPIDKPITQEQIEEHFEAVEEEKVPKRNPAKNRREEEPEEQGFFLFC